MRNSKLGFPVQVSSRYANVGHQLFKITHQNLKQEVFIIIIDDLHHCNFLLEFGITNHLQG